MKFTRLGLIIGFGTGLLTGVWFYFFFILGGGELFSFFSYDYAKAFLYRWQTLVGSLLGTAAPISIYLVGKWYFERREHLALLERVLVLGINNVIDIDAAVDTFYKEKLPEMIKSIDLHTSQNSYSYGTAFFPLFSVYRFPDELLKFSSGSAYIDNKVLRLFLNSKDLVQIIDDIRRQFESTIESNKTLSLAKGSSPKNLNDQFKENIQNYHRLLKEDFFGKSIPFYFKWLIEARVTLAVYKRKGWILWRLQFTPSFKIFKNRNTLQSYRDSTTERIEITLKPEVDKALKDLLKNLTQHS